MVIFFVLAVMLVGLSLLVVFVRNVVHAAVALVAALMIIAIFFLTLQAPMVGVLQIMVYAGAIMVLFLFVIMFLNPMTPERPRRAWWGLGVLSASLLAIMLLFMVSKGQLGAGPLAGTEWFGSPETLAKSLFTEFVLPFEIASIVLLVAIVGAVVLAKRER
ncbi:MAG TPA: NADH-quinone oxidoreductase subunit J [Terriglobales bacterium]|nr:NADH-quinone oxidoreductase subunit J [Terriglobales bacterium]